MKRLFTIMFLLTATLGATWAQTAASSEYVRCYTVEKEAERRAENPKMQSPEQFEQWMAQKIAERKANPNARQAAYTIPYVVHVVHKGESVGSGTNLSQAIVDEQMEQINEDFRRENADAVNTPAAFLAVAGSFDVEFVPAVVDPDGAIMTEPGINRVNGVAEFGTGVWSTGAIDATLKPATIWDPTLYMNVWVCDISGGILGYAQFPEGSTLPGMPGGAEDPTTDGVVILYSSVGGLDIPGTAVPYHLGRTLTHELGHWVGLRHIWGDGGCGVDDFCADTPNSDGANFGCPAGSVSCGSVDMPENYMDYSDDACFNIFTMDQVDRMITVMENSPRRNELLTSTVWQIPATDTIIAGIDQDDDAGCAPLVVTFSDDSYSGPDADPITSYEWNFDVDGLGGASPATFSGANPGAVTFSSVGTYTISLTIDNGTYTGVATTEVTVEGTVSLDVAEDFEAGLPAWNNTNWQLGTVGFASAASMYQRNWTNSGRESAYLTTPSIDMDVDATYILLTFDVSHANYSLTGLGADEGLAIEYSTDCGGSWTEIWRKLDSDNPPFYTVQNTSSSWVPGANEWREEEVDLTALLGESAVQLRFHGISDYGNDTYIDNILVAAVTVDPSSIEAEFEADVTTGCQGLEVNFTDISVAGSGTTITSWEWDFDTDGLGGASPATFSGETPPTVTFANGGDYVVQLIVGDGSITDTFELTIEVEPSLLPPVVMGFEAGIPANWPTNDNWESAPVGFASANSAFQNNWNSTNTAIMTTPPVDLSGPADEATLSFDVAHVYWTGDPFPDEGMAVSYSLDCGETWTEIYRKLDSDDVDPFFTVPGGSGSFWSPASDNDWRNDEIDIISLVGNPSVKFRFTGIGAFGNNTYLDNVNISTRVVPPNTIEAEFEASAAVICEGQSVTFTDLSLIGSAITDASWSWDFDATGAGTATPSTYDGQTPPAVMFESAGTYTVELTVTGDGGAVSDSYSLEIEVEGSNALPISEDFEAGVPPAGWNADDGISQAPVGFGSANSAFFDNYNIQNLRADLTLPSLDFNSVGRAELTFDLSHTFYAGPFGNLYDTLAISYSLDCGETWTEFWRKDDGDPINPLYTADGTGGFFSPASDEDWRMESADVTFLQGYGNVRIRFENRGAYGNSLFIDNVNIDAELVEPDEVFAYFTIEGGAGCAGSAVDFIDASTAGINTAITSWEWDFDATGIGGAEPSTYSGQTPPSVTFNTPGEYQVVLTVSDGSVSDDYTATVSVGASEDLTYTQNFSALAFPPMGWTNILWEQALQSSDALLGSLWADNYLNVNLKSRAWTPALDLSWYDQIVMTFDVSHSRYSTAENEGLIISGSNDCGATFSEVWSKYDYDADPLYTVEDLNTSAFFPESASDWREETVDLSVFNDDAAVRVEFFNDGYYGNNTFVDDISVEGWLFNPTDLTAENSGPTSIDLNWTDNSGKESAYEVLRWNEATSAFEVIATLGADATSYTDSGLDGPAFYTYMVCAYNEKARACSDAAEGEIVATLEVTGLTAVLVDPVNTSIELFWTDESTTEDGFYIKRSEDGVNFTIINTLTPNQEYYIDEFLDETTTYYYQVCAFNDAEIAESNIASETTDIIAPSNLVATANGVDVVLTWTDNSLVEEGVQIKRSLTSGGPYTVVTVVAANVTTYTDFNKDELTEYCYVVCAYNSVDESCSNEDCATTDIASAVFDDLAEAIVVYPNPASSYVDLQLSSVNGDMNVKIFNQIGGLMLEQTLIGGATRRIELDNFASGVYLIHIQTDNGYTTKKLVVE